jgi:hypothetical protein
MPYSKYSVFSSEITYDKGIQFYQLATFDLKLVKTP